MKNIKLLFLTLSICLLSCKNDLNKKVEYTVSPIVINGASMLKVNILCDTDTNGETKLLFLNDTWGEKELHNTLHSIKSVNEGVKVSVIKDSSWVVIKHQKDVKSINLEYVIKQDTKSPLTTEKTYRPIIQPEYFHVFAHGLFMLPLDFSKNKAVKFNAYIKWKDFPEDYTIQNSFGTNNRDQLLENISEDKFLQTIFLGGDYRAYEFDINNNKVVYSTRGDWEVLQDSTIVDILKKTITAQRYFWKDQSQEYFSVNLTPITQENGSSFQGTGLTNSFNCTASNNEFLEIEGLVYLFNHELLHNWIGHLIINDNEEEQYWFSEGFTDYYTNKNIAKYNINGFDRSYFIDKMNETIRLLYTSPVKNAPNSDINYDNFWKDSDYEKLPYRRGMLLAFYLDHKIKQDTNREKNLDDILLEFKNDALTNDQKISHSYFISTVNKYLHDDFMPFFDTHIEKGKLYNLETMFKGFGFEYKSTTKVFDLGFTFSEDKKSIIAINQNSEAYKAGLRKGDIIKGRSYYYNSIKHVAEFTIVRNEKDTTIKFLPIREANIPQLKNNIHNKSLLAF